MTTEDDQLKTPTPEAAGDLDDAAEVAAEEAAANSSSEQEIAANGTADILAKRAKKKKKKKKKSPLTAELDDDAFSRWISMALEATLPITDLCGLTAQERLRPKPVFFGYNYTGKLRPAHVCPQMRMPDDIMHPDYAKHPEGHSLCERKGLKMIPVLEGEQLEIMRTACRLGREVLDIASRFMREGVTGDEIDRTVWHACVDRKIYPSPLNYYRFPKSVCVSPNEVICHGIPDCRPLEGGDIVNLDISIYYKGFHSDLNETFFIGECDAPSHSLVRIAYNALREASLIIHPGTFYRDLGPVIHGVAVKGNCSVVTQYCGHGVGELFHGPPKVPHYKKNKAVGVMKPGHVFTVEPMINMSQNCGDTTWPDQWTAVTLDGKKSAQFEHTFLVTETGVEVMTARQNTDRTTLPEYSAAMFQR